MSPFRAAVPTAVRAEFSGFEPGSQVFIQQCVQVAPGVFGTYYDNTCTLEADDNGVGVSQLTVKRVFEALNEQGNSLGEFDCATTEHDCFVSFSQGGAPPSLTQIFFAKN